MVIKPFYMNDVWDMQAKATVDLIERSRWGILKALLVTLGGLAGLAIAISLVLWPWILKDRWPKLVGFATSDEKRLLVISILLAASFLLYMLRVFMRPLYGVCEIIIGMMSCWSGLKNSSPIALSATVSFIGGIYIMVRGFDNFFNDKYLTDKYDKARKERP